MRPRCRCLGLDTGAKTKVSDEASDDPQYSFKPSISGAMRRFTLTPAGLAWNVGRHQGTWAYGDIAMIRMSYRPLTMQSNRYRADIRHRSGHNLSIMSATWQGIAVVAPQSRAYRDFLVELNRRVAAANPGAWFRAGLPMLPYLVACVLIVALAAALMGLLARAVATDNYAGAAFILAMGALFGWPFGNFMRRNQPADFEAGVPPVRVLPPD